MAFSILLSDRTIATLRVGGGGVDRIAYFQYPTLGSNHRYLLPGEMGGDLDNPFSILLSDRTIATLIYSKTS